MSSPGPSVAPLAAAWSRPPLLSCTVPATSLTRQSGSDAEARSPSISANRLRSDIQMRM
jgi:hypothetical protein